MKVLIADQFEQSGIDGLREAGCDVVVDPGLKDEALGTALRESSADVLVVRSTKVTADMMDGGRLALIVRAGAGYNTIDVAAASARGIYVSNCPGKNAIAVAELAFGLILALDRRIPDNVAALRAGRWDKKGFSKARGLKGRTLGLLGFGSIAQEVARRAQAFGMDVVVWTRRFGDGGDVDFTVYGLDPAARDSSVIAVATPSGVAEVADVLSVHVALGPETRGLVNADLLDRLRPGAIVVNTSRAEVVDHEALATAVREKGLRVGLDVFPDEPTTPTGEYSLALLGLPGVYGTHHIGASTEQAQEAIAAETVRIVRSFSETGRVPNVVNLARRSPATHLLVVRHRDRPGVLAHVFEHLREDGINAQETENVVFEGAEAAVARINLDRAPSSETLTSISRGDNVLSAQLVAL
ncbi:MAG TPA: 3-phosphoglycerate dehydrogenase family protein [Candidatus Limnocylindrales bacterium]